jgi:hypothetical protein
MLFFELFPAFMALVCFTAALSLFIANWHATQDDFPQSPSAIPTISRRASS